MDEQHIACAHDNRRLLDKVIGELNESGGPWQFRCHYYSDDEVIRNVLGKDFGMLCPRSALSLQKLEEDWQERRGPTDYSIFADQVSFGLTPVVFFMSHRLADDMDVLETPFGWRTLTDLIKKDKPIRIRHAAFSKTDGTAVSIAQQLVFQHLNIEQDAESVAQSVRALERQVEEYGPTDDEVLHRAVGDGIWNADLVIAQERSIIAAAEQIPNLIGTIVYPHDGALGIPNAAARIAEWRRPGIDEAFHEFSHRLSALTDQELHHNGLHASAEELSSRGSIVEFAAAQSAPVRDQLRWAPHAGTTPLVLPARRVVQGIRSMAAATKRGVDVCLLFDISGSMGEGNKLEEASRGVEAFLQLLQGASSRACLITFQSRANVVTSLSPNFRSGYPLRSLRADGGTALLDAVDLGVKTLERDGDQDHIWAIVGFTDGIENASSTREADVVQRLISSSRIRFYGIAYGSDADFTILAAMASASGGFVVRGDPGQIKAIYERLSTYV